MTFPNADAGKDWERRQLRRRRPRPAQPGRRPRAKSSNTAYAQLMLDVGPENAGVAGQAPGHRRARCSRYRRSCSAPTRCRCSTWPAAYSTLRRQRRARRPRRRHPGHRRRGQRALRGARPSATRVLERGRRRAGQLGRSTRSSRAAPAPAPSSASRRPARPAPPTSTATPGSSATRARSPPRCGWATPAPTDPLHGQRARRAR